MGMVLVAGVVGVLVLAWLADLAMLDSARTRARIDAIINERERR
jgi:hypothetical protein